MAGSYKHCTKKDGTFRDEDFTDFIENLGDAWEACEEMHWMINYLADGDRKRIDEALDAYCASKR